MDRVERIIELRKEHKTLEEIGKEFGITRERVRQILEKQGITGCSRPIPLPPPNCERCGKQLLRYRKRFCDLICKYGSLEEQEKQRKERQHNYYLRNKDRHREWVKARYLKVKDTPEYKEKQKGYSDTWLKKHKSEINQKRRERFAADPIFRQKIRDGIKKYQLRRRFRYNTDPIYREKIKARYRDYYLRKKNEATR